MKVRKDRYIVPRGQLIEAMLEFAEASQRFRSREPRGQPDSENGN